MTDFVSSRLFAVTVCLVTTPLLEAQGRAPVAADPLNGYLDRAAELAQPLVESRVCVGLTIGILLDGKLGVRGVGRVRKDAAGAPDGDTVYEIGSISKVFTGILLAEAIDQKLVNLDDPVEKYFPETVRWPNEQARGITLRHLTTHTSGLPRMPANFRPKDPRNPYADYDEAAMYAFLSKVKLAAKPGAKWAYSNLGVGLLGHVLAKVHGKERFADILARVTKPLGLKDTTIALSEDQRKRLALPYEEGAVPASNWDLDALAGAGAVRSTAKDMLKFARANLAATTKQGGMMKALAMSHESCFQPSLAQRASGGSPMGMGWIRRSGVIWHNGGTGGYRTHLLIHKKKRFAVVVLTNSTGKGDVLARRIERMLLGGRVKPIEVRAAIDLDADVLRRYVGEYERSKAMKFTVTERGGVLYVKLTGQSALPVFPMAKNRFFYRRVQAEIEFDVDAAGKAEGLTLYQNGLEFAARKLR